MRWMQVERELMQQEFLGDDAHVIEMGNLGRQVSALCQGPHAKQGVPGLLEMAGLPQHPMEFALWACPMRYT